MKKILFILGILVSVYACGQTSYVDLDVKSSTAASDGHTIFSGGKGWKMTHAVLFNNTDDSLGAHLIRLDNIDDTLAVFRDSLDSYDTRITAAGGGGYWDRTGTLLSPTTSGDDIRLGGSEQIQFGGTTTYISGSSNDIFIYNSGSLTWSWQDANQSLVYGHILPGTASIDLGSSSDFFRQQYFGRAYFNNTSTYIDESGGALQLTDPTGTYDIADFALQALDLNTLTGTTYTFVLADQSRLITLSNAAAITLTVPPNSSVAFPLGTQISIMQGGPGQVTVTPGAGVTIRSADTKLKTRVQFSTATLIKTATDVWLLSGDTSL
jgi:hypothetical protein